MASSPLQSKTAVVTGSATGIGLAIAEALAGAGANVLLHGLADRAQGEALAASFRGRFGTDCWFSNADLRAPDAITEMIAAQIERTPEVHILVNNAGMQHTAALEDFPRARWDDIVAVNLSAAFHCTRVVLPAMRRGGWGRIVNIASVHGLVASPYKAAYVASKHGLIGLTRVAALENAGRGITANAICPGWVDTELIAAQIRELAEQKGLPIEMARTELVSGKQPLPKMTAPAAIGALVVYLCSEQADTITGAALSIDGGWSAQ